MTLPDRWFQTVQAAGKKLGEDTGFARDYTNAIKSAMGFNRGGSVANYTYKEIYVFESTVLVERLYN